ncbi:MAG: cell division FtsZ family protein [Candidatus Thermoplasmatota archaeon]|jgi:cell division protein FtsZ|nr:cell division FtsZ family protein [Candidatus Thermoplasmatota archaeon]MCL5987963.1 cell division FtsZ family protein [Candidatus Thermoplasmatota archaeon]
MSDTDNPFSDSDIFIDEEELKKIVEETKQQILVIGVGGAGTNTVSMMAQKRDQFKSENAEVYFIATNTDAQHLRTINADYRFVIGKELCKGRGAGADPKVGEEAAKESTVEIDNLVKQANIAIVVAGMGGGTGTGAGPVIANRASIGGAITIGIASTPLEAEGKVRESNAESGIKNFLRATNTVILFSNRKLLEMVPKERVDAAFSLANSIMMDAIMGIIDSVTRVNSVNAEITDLKRLVSKKGIGAFGAGISDSPPGQRVKEAFNQAINNPFSDVNIGDAKGLLISITGGKDLSAEEHMEAMKLANAAISENALIIQRYETQPEFEGKVKIVLFATGIGSKYDGNLSEEIDFEN